MTENKKKASIEHGMLLFFDGNHGPTFFKVLVGLFIVAYFLCKIKSKCNIFFCTW